jgi:hypothetical protein
MASLSNINGLFDVHSTGAILFSTSHGTSGQILKSNGNAAPTWVDTSTVIGGPYLPLSGGTLTGATATASGISFTVGGALTGTSATFSDNITSTSNGGSASIYINSTRPTLGFTDTNSFGDANDIYIIRGAGGNKLQFQWYDNSAGTTTETFNITSSGTASFLGNLIVGSTSKTTNTVVQALSNDDVNAGFEARGASQGTGYFYAGQSASHGGGMFYNGNGVPAFAAGESNDAISFYRRAANVQTVVFDFMYNSNTVRFKGDTTVAGKISANGGIDGLTLANGGISGSNYDIAGVNQLTIADPGEGIVFTGTTTLTLAVIDDTVDDKLKLTNATQLDLNSTARITNLVDPTGNQDAATKAYVDSQPQGDITGVTAGTGMTGGGTSGNVTLNVIGGDGITANADDIAVDSTVVRTTGAQSIGGVKNYTDDSAWIGGNSFIINDAATATAPMVRIPAPGGAGFDGPSGSTGAIKIKLPVASNNNNVMMSFDVKIFDYAENESLTISISGYAYSSTLWTRETVVIQASKTDRDYTVRFGNDATSHCVWIGELTSTWAHLKVGVFNFIGGHSIAEEDFGSGWDITIVSAFDTVNDTRSDNLVVAKTANALVSGNQSITGNLTVSGDTTVSGDIQVNGNQVRTLGGNADVKFAVWSGSTYGIGMTSGVTLGDLNDYAMTFCMNNETDRGFWWGYSGQNKSAGAMSLTTNGKLYVSTQIKAPIYYDTNTSYYGNFASTSVLNALQFNYTQHGSANNIRMGNSTTMNAISSGTNNAAFGVEALGGCSTGSRNFAYGYAALGNLSSGGSNIAMGDATGYNVTSGSNNLLFGQNAGRTGYQSPYQSIAGITSGSNQIHMGNESHTTARIQISWTVNSDSRDKTDITPINVGLDFVKDLNPVTFRWDKRSSYEDRTPTGENKLEELTLGFLAQEVEEVEKSYGYDIVNKTNLVVDRDIEQDHYGITYEKMIPILTKAIQELEARVKELENK